MTASPLRLRLGRRLRDYRLRASLTQRQLGDRSGGIAAGETWNFQAWFRDPLAGGAASGFSSAYQVTLPP